MMHPIGCFLYEEFLDPGRYRQANRTHCGTRLEENFRGGFEGNLESGDPGLG